LKPLGWCPWAGVRLCLTEKLYVFRPRFAMEAPPTEPSQPADGKQPTADSKAPVDPDKKAMKDAHKKEREEEKKKKNEAFIKKQEEKKKKEEVQVLPFSDEDHSAIYCGKF
jgi:hypothetical protein